MLAILGFVGVLGTVTGLIHFYLWKRLVRDTLRPGRVRRAAGFVMLALAVLVPATLIGVRSEFAEWLAWPGYLWLALMFYLFLALVALEVPRLLARLAWRSSARSTAPAPVAGSPFPSETTAAASTAMGGGSVAAGSVAGSSGAGASLPGSAGAVSAGAGSSAAGSSGAGGPGAGSSRAGASLPGSAGAVSAGAGSSAAGSSAAGSSGAGGSGAASGSGSGDAVATPTDDGAARGSGVDRRLVLARGAAIFAGLTAAGITGYGVRTALGPPQLDRVQIPLAKLPRAMDGTRIAVVSDIHIGPLTGTNHVRRIVDLINSVDADIVAIVGDLVDGTVAELGPAAAALADIRARHGASFVTGNHEYYSGYQEWIAEVARLGVRPLRNERLEIRARGGVLDLAGVNDVGGDAYGDAPDMAKALGGRDPARPVVLMAHQPLQAFEAAKHGVDLQVSGHTHGGQMMPFNLLIPLQQPVTKGLGVVDGVPVYVTNGAGFWGPPVRVGAPPQVTLLNLRTP